jgi:hypothetical protein
MLGSIADFFGPRLSRRMTGWSSGKAISFSDCLVERSAKGNEKSRTPEPWPYLSQDLGDRSMAPKKSGSAGPRTATLAGASWKDQGADVRIIASLS